MIGRLRGCVDGRGESWALIDVGGVGYMVEGSARMLESLPGDGEAVTLAIETYVREDQLRLFGFLSEEDRSWFRLLMGVQGVGARVALAIQGVLSSRELALAVAAEDKAMVSRAPGVGPESGATHCSGIARQSAGKRVQCQQRVRRAKWRGSDRRG